MCALKKFMRIHLFTVMILLLLSGCFLDDYIGKDTPNNPKAFQTKNIQLKKTDADTDRHPKKTKKDKTKPRSTLRKPKKTKPVSRASRKSKSKTKTASKSRTVIKPRSKMHSTSRTSLQSKEHSSIISKPRANSKSTSSQSTRNASIHLACNPGSALKHQSMPIYPDLCESKTAVIRDEIGTHHFSFDSLGRVTQHDGPWENDTQNFNYTDEGQLQKLTLNGDSTQNFFYDNQRRLIRIEQGTLKFTYQYPKTHTSQYQRLLYPNTISEYRSYNPDHQLNNQRYFIGERSLIARDFVYNKQGLLIHETLNQDIDLQNRFKPIKQQEIINMDNQLMTTRLQLWGKSANNPIAPLINTPPSQLNIPEMVHRYSYDDNGNQIQGVTDTGVVFNAIYNQHDQLCKVSWQRQIEYQGHQQTEQHEKIFRYFYNGHIGEIRYLINNKQQQLLRFVRRGEHILQERNQDNRINRQLLWGQPLTTGQSQLLSSREGSETSAEIWYYLYDGQGRISQVRDHQQQVLAAYAYSPFGEIIASAKNNVQQPYQLHAKRKDQETGWVHDGKRIYSPNLGRWLNQQSSN